MLYLILLCHLHFFRYVRNLLLVSAKSEHCCLATKAEDAADQYALVLCNAIGTPMDSKFIEIGK